MTDQTIVAVYDTAAHAQAAVHDLIKDGVPATAIDRHTQEGTYTGGAATATARPAEAPGFWSSLFGGEPDHDTAVYDRSMGGGSTAVSVKMPEEHVENVMNVLERHNPIDIDERAGSYGLTHTTTERRSLAAAESLAGTGATATTGGDTMQLSEESLSVGKRVVNRGTTRIRRFVVETPVEENVSLHEERVSIERRPVTDGRPVTDSFTDRTIEMTEHSEEAVVSKATRVVEEIGLRREATDRTETVRDTVRREDVEIVKDPAERTGTASDTTVRKPAL